MRIIAKNCICTMKLNGLANYKLFPPKRNSSVDRNNDFTFAKRKKMKPNPVSWQDKWWWLLAQIQKSIKQWEISIEPKEIEITAFRSVVNAVALIFIKRSKKSEEKNPKQQSPRNGAENRVQLSFPLKSASGESVVILIFAPFLSIEISLTFGFSCLTEQKQQNSLMPQPHTPSSVYTQTMVQGLLLLSSTLFNHHFFYSLLCTAERADRLTSCLLSRNDAHSL